MRVCMLRLKPLRHDTRARREAITLAEAGYDVTVLDEPALVRRAQRTLDDLTRRSAMPPAWLERASFRTGVLLSVVTDLVRLRPDVIHVHDAATLLPALVGARLTGARLVYDSNELATNARDRKQAGAGLVGAIERLAVPRAALVVAASDGLAARLRDRYRLPGTPVVVRNVATVIEGQPRGGPGLRQRLDLPPGTSLVVHQGAAAPGRGCATLVRAVADIDDAHLVFLGDDESGLNGEAMELAAMFGAEERLHFLTGQRIEDLEQANVGVILLDGTCASNEVALPDELFEYVTAGIPVVASDLPELGALVREWRIGWTVDPSDPEAVTGALRVALAAGDLEPLRARLRDAQAGLRWPIEQRRLLDAYEQLAARCRAGRADGRVPRTQAARYNTRPKRVERGPVRLRCGRLQRRARRMTRRRVS